jgi:hypothetical protein
MDAAFFNGNDPHIIQNPAIIQERIKNKKGKKQIMAVGKGSLNRAAKAMQNKPSGIEFEEKETKPMQELMKGLTEIVEENNREEREYKKEMVQFIDDAIKEKDDLKNKVEHKENETDLEKELEKPNNDNLVIKAKKENSSTKVEKVIKVPKKNDKALIIDDKKIIKAADKKKTKPVINEGNIIIGTIIKKQNDKPKPAKPMIVSDVNVVKKTTAETKNVTDKNKVTLRTTIVSIGDEMPNYFL